MFRFSAILLVLSIFAASASGETALRIATYSHYPPWTITSPTGALAGFEIDLISDLCLRIHKTCAIVPSNWETVIDDLRAERFDGYIGAMSITEERTKKVRFTAPYAYTPEFFATQRDSSLVKLVTMDRLNLDRSGPDDQSQLQILRDALRPMVVGVHAETVYEYFMRHYFPDLKELKIYHSEQEKLKDLVDGQIDAVLDGGAALIEFIKQPDSQGASIVLFGPAISGGELGRGIGIALPPNAERLQQSFDQAIAAAKSDGTIGRISLKWFGYSVAVE